VTCGSLFAGIGGFDLGFQRAGIRTIWQVEIDEYCRRVLARHFPDAERFGDIRECGAQNLKPVDIICGGFPCQDISLAGSGDGLDGERSGLWREMFRITSELRPKYLVVENVAALLVRGVDRVLGDLAEIGYDAEWQIVRADWFGLAHPRRRLFIVAHPSCESVEKQILVQFQRGPSLQSGRVHWVGIPKPSGRDDQPELAGVAHGVPDWVDRFKSLGNAVVPQIAEWIGRRLMEAE
jgi:DNA (cytosine-5)-methyltransferase 1